MCNHINILYNDQQTSVVLVIDIDNRACCLVVKIFHCFPDDASRMERKTGQTKDKASLNHLNNGWHEKGRKEELWSMLSLHDFFFIAYWSYRHCMVK